MATGTAGHLDEILKTVENDFDQIDASAVIFGSPGLFQVYDVYDVLMQHIRQDRKPIYPILPSVVNVKDEIEYFHRQGFAGFPDEVLFGQAFAKAWHHQKDLRERLKSPEETAGEKNVEIRNELKDKKGYLSPPESYALLKDFEIPVVEEAVFTEADKAVKFATGRYPVVLKVTGILHKSDVGGVRLNIRNEEELQKHFEELMQINGASGVLIQAQKQGTELFVGVKKEKDFGHLILFGAGGIFVEVLKDFQTILAPATETEIRQKIKKLQMYPLLKGIRGQQGIDMDAFVDLILKVSKLVETYPQISEMDLNPVLATPTELFVVDNRIKFN